MSRADDRLDIARCLLGLPFDSDVMAAIRALPKDRQEHLRGLVNWVEEYEADEAAHPAQRWPAREVREVVTA